MKITVNAPCKINLFLKVFERMPDGFHAMESMMVKVGFYDVMHFDFKSASLKVEVANKPKLSGPDNLVYKAITLYAQAIKEKINVSVVLEKNVFLSAGLGGGSSDAGVSLRLMQERFKALTELEVLDIAASLGSDVPFFYLNHNMALAYGRGEKIKPWPNIERIWVLLVNPNVEISTPKVYKNLGRSLTYEYSFDTWQNLKPYVLGFDQVVTMCKQGNDLEVPAVLMEPKIGLIKRELSELGAQVSQLSGSGATVFGLFESFKEAKKAHEDFESRYLVKLVETLN